MAYWLFKWFLVRPVLRVWLRPNVIGAQHIPRRGPVIVASNHLGFWDPVVLPAMVRRRMTFPAKREWFEGRSLRGRAIAWFLRTIRQIPMDRQGGTASTAGLSEVVAVLQRGEVVGIYPEGTRSPDGRLHRGHTGVGRLARATGAPVVPCAISGTGRPRGPVTLVLGPPVDLQAWLPVRPGTLRGASARDVDPVAARGATDAVMDAIAQLSGQERVPTYATRTASAGERRV